MCWETEAAKLDKILFQSVLSSWNIIFSKEEEFTETEHNFLIVKKISWKGL